MDTEGEDVEGGDKGPDAALMLSSGTEILDEAEVTYAPNINVKKVFSCKLV